MGTAIARLRVRLVVCPFRWKFAPFYTGAITNCGAVGWRRKDGKALSFRAAADKCYSTIPYFRFFDFFSCPCELGPWRASQRRCIHTDTHTESNAHTSFNPNSYAHSGSCADTDAGCYYVLR
jgi:hypothetical protein